MSSTWNADAAQRMGSAAAAAAKIFGKNILESDVIESRRTHSAKSLGSVTPMTDLIGGTGRPLAVILVSVGNEER